MGHGMSQILPRLYVGNYRDSKDLVQLNRYDITHILAIHDTPRRLFPDKNYLCVMASDNPDQNLSQYFTICNDFIHGARIHEGNVLIHCLAGMSRSITVCIAYIISVTQLSWQDGLKVVRAGRAIANPNLGFQNQLQDFETNRLAAERLRLKERFPSVALRDSDREQCEAAISHYEEQLFNKDICEGRCLKRGEKCPTGMCTAQTKKSLFSTRSNSASRRSSTASSSSCPNSPRRSRLGGSSAGVVEASGSLGAAGTLSGGGGGDYLRGLTEDEVVDVVGPSSLSSSFGSSSSGSSAPTTARPSSGGIHRSASTTNARPRTAPAGLYSYTGSAPPSVHGSLVNINASSQGTAIYVGYTPTARGSVSASSFSLGNRQRSGSQVSVSSNTPSPQSSPRRVRSKKLVQ